MSIKPSRRAMLGAGLAATGAALSPVLRPGPAAAASFTPHRPAVATEPLKTASTYYTAERVAAARRNIENFAWARQIRDSALGYANRMAGQTDDWLWSLVPGQTLPRSINVNYVLGSPVTGKDVYQLGFYPFRIDQANRPWKVVDPLAQQRGLPYIFPTNDFGAFYASALDEHGVFDPARGDRSLLVNQLYPEMGPDWCVDDGLGYVDGDGNRWTFIAYYTHYGLWWTGVSSIGASAQIYTAIRTLRDAYVYTGDPRYAHAGIILLDRIADLYPSMDVGAYSEDYRNNDPGTRKGKVLGSIWETGFVRELISAYDAFFPALADTDQAGVVPFLRAKAEQYGLPAKDSVAAIRLNLENNLLRQVLPAVKNAQIYGNFGTHQAALAMAGLVLDHDPETKEWIDFVFASGGILPDPEWHVTGGDVYATLVDRIDRDGWGAESSPHYSNIWFDNLKVVADVLDGYAGYPGVDLYTHPKFRKMFTAGPRIVALNKFLPSIGDSGACGQPGIGLVKSAYAKGFEEYGTPMDAQFAYLLNRDTVTGLNTGIFSADPAGEEQAIQRVIDTEGRLDLDSDHLSGYGLAFLRDGEGAAKREAWIYHGRSNAAHGAFDALNLGLYAFGLDLAPDHGYPEATDYTNFSQEWTHNTISHNTVVVDETPQEGMWVGEPRGFATGELVRVADIAAPTAYPRTSVYRRVTAMVTVDEQNAYLVDVFRIAGGSDHVFSFHSGEGPATADVELTEQPTGTYAGADIPMPERRANPTRWDWGGFDWLDQVARADSPQEPFSVDWDIVDTWNAIDPDVDAHLRLTVLTEVDELALANGYPPQNNPRNPRSLRYALLRRRGRSGRQLASQFVSVVEPYVGQRFVHDTRKVSVRALGGRIAPHEAAAVRVTLANGRTDYIVSSLRPDVLLQIDGKFLFSGGFGVRSLRDGRPEYTFSHAATTITGRITDFTRELAVDNQLVIRPDVKPGRPEDLTGSWVYVSNDGERNAAYQIVAAELDRHGRLVANIGDATTIRGYVDKNDFTKGFRYDVATGASARIPLSQEWRRP